MKLYRRSAPVQWVVLCLALAILACGTQPSRPVPNLIATQPPPDATLAPSDQPTTPASTDFAPPTRTATPVPPSPAATATPGTPTAPATLPSAAAGLPFAYGWDVAFFAAYQPSANVAQYAPTSFNWLRITGLPDTWEYLCNQFKLPYNVLLRLNRVGAGVSPAEAAADAGNWARLLHQHNGSERCVQAFEIGNEPNLSGAGRFGGPVDPAAYADQLCAAYDAIKAVDPAYVVVSAGLGMTGGDTPDYLDEVAFTRRTLERIRAQRGSAGACFDALGAHNYGFRTGFGTDPADAAACPDGMCFRGVEQLHSVLAGEFGVSHPVWSTSVGWMRDYSAGGCAAAGWAAPFSGFAVADQAQGDNLVGAFQYARTNWPWLGAMFVANLDYNQRPWAPDPCQDPDGWFAVKGHPAEAALEAMPRP